MPPKLTGPAQNLLLAALPASDRKRLLALCEPVQLIASQSLYTPGQRVSHVFFPTGGFVSLITPVDGHAGLEIGLVGIEGLVGIPVILGVSTSHLHAFVQGTGSAWRIDAAAFLRELKRAPALQRRVNRYLYVLVTQLALTAACTHFHVLQSRLARWLLMTRDRAGSNDFHLTHEFLAFMLGVRRSGITQAASRLQKLKLINYNRGDVSIMDGAGLESAACACYAIDRATYAQVLP